MNIFLIFFVSVSFQKLFTKTRIFNNSVPTMPINIGKPIISINLLFFINFLSFPNYSSSPYITNQNQVITQQQQQHHQEVVASSGGGGGGGGGGVGALIALKRNHAMAAAGTNAVVIGGGGGGNTAITLQQQQQQQQPNLQGLHPDIIYEEMPTDYSGNIVESGDECDAGTKRPKVEVL